MHRHTGRGLAVAALLGVVWVAGGWAGQAGKTEPPRDTVTAIVEGSVRAMAIAASAAQQDEVARAHWMKFFEGQTPPSYETPNLLIYGAVPGKTLKEVGDTLDRLVDLARTALKMEVVPWPGKLTVYLVAERAQFKALVRGIERRNPDPSDTGSLDVRRDQPHVIAGPPGSIDGPSIEKEAGQLIAGALLAKKAGPGVPEWVTDGFGRATVLVAGPKAELLAEHRKAALALLGRKRHVKAIWDGTLEGEEVGPLRESLIEYLAYSKRFSRFDQFLAGFRVEENRPNPSTADALKAANVNADALNAVWQRWVVMTTR